ncbi:MAG: heparinase II/III family protein, partial [Oscillospiraceae bacterium]|nr:heparinase II/III family protein [Oscillospiraceae bacterium]
DIYILPEGGLTNLAEAKANGTKIASVDYSADKTAMKAEAEMLVDEIDLKKGTQVLLFVVTGAGAKATSGGVHDYFTYPYKLTLTKVEKTEPEPEPENKPARQRFVFDNLELGIAGNTRLDTITSYEQTGNTWRYLAASPNAKASQLKNYYLNGDTRDVDHFIAVEINVPGDGTYKPEFSYLAVKGEGCMGDIYILPEGGFTNLAEAKANGTKIASVDYSADATVVDTKAKMLVDEIELKKGTQVLLFVVTGKGAKATTGGILDYFTYPYMLTITPVVVLPPTEPSGAKLTYDFKANSTISDGDIKNIGSGETAEEAFPASSTDGWSAYSYSSNAEYIQKDNGNNITFMQKKGEYLQLSSRQVGGWVAIKVPLTNRGSYNAFLSYKQIKGYGAAEIYTVDMPKEELDEEGKREYINKALKNAPRVAKINSHNVQNFSIEDAPEMAEFTVGTANDDSAVLLVFKTTGQMEKKKILLDSLVLDGTGEYEGEERVVETTYTLRPGKALKEEGETATLSLFNENGEEVTNFEIADITSSDEAVATVSEKTVTAGSKHGRTKLSATVTVEGENVKATGVVRFVESNISGKRVEAKINSRKESWTNPGYLRDTSLYSGLARAQSDISGFEIGDGITEEYTDGWSWYADSVDEKTETSFIQNNKIALSARMQDGEWFAIKMKFEDAGKYRAIVTHRASIQSPYADMYFIPVPGEGEKVSDYLTDEYKVGRINSHNPDVEAWNAAAATTETYLGDVYAEEPGEYLAVIMMTGRAATKKMYLYFENIVFSGTNPVASIGGSWQEAVSIGDTVTLDKSLITYEADIPQYKEETTISFRSLTPDIVSVDENGVVTGIGNGVGRIEVTATYDGESVVGEYTIIVGSGKMRRSYYTDEKVENAKRNIERYDWAKAEYDKWIKAADKFVEQGADTLYNLVTTQELPRSLDLSYRFGDTGAYVCIYCDEELSNEYGLYPWVLNVFDHPWKIQCPECKRYFPSNDFGSFYELGIDENGNWDYELALQKHHEKFVCASGENCACQTDVGERGSDAWKDYYGYGKGYLKNTEYDEVGKTLGVAAEEVDRWAVDDGWGYEYEYQVKNGNIETRCKPFIAYYNTWGIWEETIPDAIESLGMAYLYTGDLKYGRAGAVLLDRVADVYPDFDITELGYSFVVADGSMVTQYADGSIRGSSRGGTLGRLHDCNISLQMVPAYDALWPAYEDKDVINYLSAKAAEMNLENKKTSAAAIRSNIENNYLREINKRIHDYRISANFTVPEKLHILAAVVLDTMPETGEWLKFVFQAGKQTGYRNVTGGNVYPQIINVVDRDGHGNEAAPGYNTGWVDNLVLMGEALDGYDKAGEYNLFENPKFKRMLKSEIDTICASVWTPNVGDYIAMGRQHLSPYQTSLIRAYKVFGDDPEYQEIILKALYHRGRREYTYIHGSIFDKDPEEIKRRTAQIVGESLEIDLPSRDLAGYGIAILRDGDWIDSANVNKNINTQRGFYIYYGQTHGHGHQDKLNLGIYAFGFDVGSDLGTPRLKTSTDPQRFELVEHTMAHNTVMVNNLNQRVTLDGNPLHFDDTDKVQLMDVEAPEVYDWLGVKEYRRTLVMVD